MWIYCRGMKKSITKSGISLNAGTLNRGFTVDVFMVMIRTVAML
jgi:hypothetical protein